MKEVIFKSNKAACDKVAASLERQGVHYNRSGNTIKYMANDPWSK